MASKPSINRLQKEYKALLKVCSCPLCPECIQTHSSRQFQNSVQEPVPNITAHPSTSSILVWHYVLEGPKGSEYEGGFYWGKIEFPSDCKSDLTSSCNIVMLSTISTIVAYSCPETYLHWMAEEFWPACCGS